MNNSSQKKKIQQISRKWKLLKLIKNKGKSEKSSDVKNVWQQELSYTADWSTQSYKHFGKPYGITKQLW